MCVNYQPADSRMIREVFGIDVPEMEFKPETWQDYLAPIILQPDDDPAYCALASYGFVPQKYKPEGMARLTTMNARAETIGQLRSYKRFWHAAQFCLVPMTGFYEPCYESGKAERWRIGMADGSPFAVAGMWRTWEREDGGFDSSFTQITINADEHPLMKRFHKPGDEKRTLVIIPPEEYGAWLRCRNPEEARSMLRLFPAERMGAEAAVVVRRPQGQNG